MNDNELAGLLGLGKSDDSPTLAWGKVTAVSGDTVTANVMGGTVSAVRCCECSVGDIVALEGQRGRWRAIGRKGGEGGSSIDLPLSMENGGTGAAYSDALALSYGLGLYSLGLGTAITSNANLNNYTTPGVYDVFSGAIAQSLSNCPSTTYGTLLVYLASDVVCQEYITGLSGIRYHRRRAAAGTWNDWRCANGIDSIVAEGTSGIWTYRKWESGYCELYTEGTTSVTFSSWGNQYEGKFFNSNAYPWTFSTTPTISARCSHVAGCIEVGSTTAPLTTCPNLYVLRPSSSSAVSGARYSVLVCGYV